MSVKNLADLYAWKKVHSPLPWKPTELGDELCGFYGGKTPRMGPNGQYDVVLVHVPCNGTWTVSGLDILQKADAAAIQIGHPIRVQWAGTRQTGNGRTMKLFTVLVADGKPIPVEDLPTIPVEH